MIYFDATKTAAAKHRSGLVRVGQRLAAELGVAAIPTSWPNGVKPIGRDDWFLTAELFSESERPGFSAWVGTHPCHLAAIFHDAIPLKLPHITWPQSVARHPGYMKLLAQFDRVWAVSNASRDELLGFWSWLGLERRPPVEVLALGADFDGAPRNLDDTPMRPPVLLCVGIIEPRKNQAFLVDVCQALWRDGSIFDLHLVGRVNPHFGKPIAKRIAEVSRLYPGRLFMHEKADDTELRDFYTRARAAVFPTIAEGCGLPLLESLWRGVPCLCSDLPVLRENADEGGCVPIALNDSAAWSAILRRVVTDDPFVLGLTREAQRRPLPTWSAAADTIRRALAG